MNPPPFPPENRTAKRKRPLLERVVTILVVLLVAFFGFRFVQLIRYLKDNPTQTDPAAERLHQAAKLVTGIGGGVAHGNTADAKVLAEKLSREMKGIRETMFVGGTSDSLEMHLLNQGEFLVFCQLNQESCVFLIHVPEMRRYTNSAKDSIAELAYVSAARLLDSAHKTGIRKLAIATRGNILYDHVLIGDYDFESKDALSRAHKMENEAALAPSLNSFFKPPEEEMPKSAP